MFALLLLGGIVAAAVLAIRGDEDDDDVAGPATTTTTTLPLSDTAEELVDRLARARQRDLHLVYSGALPGGAEGKLTVEVWWKGQRTRQSLVAEAPQQGRQESAAFVLGDGNVFCQRTGTIPWACQRAASTATAAGRDAGIIEALASSLNGKEVTAEKATVGDDTADCYTLDPATGDVLCLRDDDVPVKFTFSGAELVLASVDTTVPDSVFEPPAEVQETPAPSTTSTAG